MRARLVIDTGYAKPPVTGGFLRIPPSVELRETDRFTLRLEWMKDAMRGLPIVIAELEPPYFADIAYRRMLERIARGVGAEVHGRQWCGISGGEVMTSISDFGIGSHTAKVLIVGDSHSVKRASGEPELPFVSANPDGCAAKFTRDLAKAGIPESELYWINAMDRTGTPHTAGDLLLEPWRRVVALGWRAYDWAVAEGFQNVVSVPHPSYWYREPRQATYRGVRAIAEVMLARGL